MKSGKSKMQFGLQQREPEKIRSLYLLWKWIRLTLSVLNLKKLWQSRNRMKIWYYGRATYFLFLSMSVP